MQARNKSNLTLDFFDFRNTLWTHLQKFAFYSTSRSYHCFLKSTHFFNLKNQRYTRREANLSASSRNCLADSYWLRHHVPIAEVGVRDPYNFLDDNRIMIGFTTRQAFKSNNLLPREEAKVVSCCRSFFVMAYEYAVTHISFSDRLLKHAEVLQVENRETASFDSIIYFVERFPILKAKLIGKMDMLYDQFTSYQLLPNSVVNNQNQVDQTWCNLNQLRQKDGVARFDHYLKWQSTFWFCLIAMLERKEYFQLFRKTRQNSEQLFRIKLLCPQYLRAKQTSSEKLLVMRSFLPLLLFRKQKPIILTTDHNLYSVLYKQIFYFICYTYPVKM